MCRAVSHTHVSWSSQTKRSFCFGFGVLGFWVWLEENGIYGSLGIKRGRGFRWDLLSSGERTSVSSIIYVNRQW